MLFALPFFLCACGGSGKDHAEEVVFRVGAIFGLSQLAPWPQLQGSSASAAELVYDFVDAHVDDMQAEGVRVVLRRRPGSPYTTQQLAATFRSRGLVSAKVLGPDHIEAVFKDAETAAASTDPTEGAGFDLGPFGVELQEPGRARLRRRREGGIDVIEIVEVSASDEWRKLMARELDVMPLAPSLYREQFAGMDSVRLVDIPPTYSAALLFNVRDPALADVEVRRRIAAGLNRQAIARVASGDESSAADWLASEPDGEHALPKRLSLIMVDSDSTLLLAASVIRHELDRLGIAVDAEPMPLVELLSRAQENRHQLVLGPLPKGKGRYANFVSPGPGVPPITGFSDPEYDAAVERADFDKAQRILDRDIPATVLYEWRAFAAVDARFCGNVTPSGSSWRWMAELHPCEDGEGEENGTP